MTTKQTKRKHWINWRKTPKGKAYVRRAYERQKEKVRQAVFAAFGSCCGRCGVDDPDVLTIDHVKGRESHERFIVSIKLWRQAAREGAGGRFRLLCFNCNWKSYLERVRTVADRGT